MNTIGILLPRSTFYPGIGIDMLEGLKSGLKNLGLNDVRIITENIGFGAEKQECYRAAERLLLQDNIPVVFAYIGHRTAQLLRPLFMAANRLLIVLDAGSHMPQEWPVSPNIFYHSLHNSLGAWFCAQLAAQDGFNKGGIASCFYDGGYLHIHALAQAWVRNGGQTVFNHATGYKKEEFSMEPLKKHMAANPDACLFSVFSAEFADWFYQDLTLHFPKQSLPVYCTPFTMEETLLSSTPYPGDNLQGIASWSRHLDNPENKIFIQSLTSTGREPNLFSLLGWEAASIAKQVLSTLNQNNNKGKEAGEQLKTFSFESPRGTIHFHSDTNHSLSPLYKAKIEKDEKGNCKLTITEKISNTKEEFEQLSAESLNNAVSGWFNSYTCI